ncbi:flavorubredoxin [Rhodobacter aestuarii]|uniref:Flavorubredoxin n=1 Tax=Rhodobacter aestuarii TaxID=453582 RepID=A0A1N7J8P0_9RHOB|nr:MULTISPECIES: FprA family A-type flavoprotein [Rhodobacter]PTV97062.1 flavorubredoxin [Rhodobacter aestuarii]SIS45713.1 Flavorubredoxin [Rhodobacter aestuarii]SOB98392.1 flavorubredoxin [Rhodobacter sp. JA431]
MSVPPFALRPPAPRTTGPEGPVTVAPGVTWIGALDPGLRSFDVILKTSNGTTYNSYLVRGSEGVAVIDTVKAEFTGAFFKRFEESASYDEIRYIVLNHLEPDHTGAVPELVRRAPQAEILLSPRGLPMLRALLGAEFDNAKVRPVTTGHSADLGDRKLDFINTPYVHWPDTQCTWLADARVLFTCDLFGSHFCDGRLFEDQVDDFRLAFDNYFDRIMRPFRSFVTSALDKIEPLDFAVLAPAHGPILRSAPRDWLARTRLLATPRRKADSAEKVLLIFYVSAYGSTAQLAQAIHDGAEEEPGVRVSLFDLEGSDISPFLDLIEEADGIALGTPTINGDAVRTVWDMLARLVDIETKGKLGAAFGSYGWSGEAVRLVEARLQGLKMRLPEPGLRVKLHPSPEELEEGRAFGRRLAQQLTGTAAPREIDFAELAAR